MHPIILYVLKVIAISALLMLYYHFGLRNKRFHFYNRFYLLFIVVLSIVIPLLRLQWFLFSSTSTQTIKLYSIINGAYGEDILVKSRTTLNWSQFLSIILITVSALLLVQLLLSILKIYKLKTIYPVRKSSEFDFIETDLQNAPFSFFKNIFWRNDIKLEEPYAQQILQHEITHIKQKHSADKIFMQLVLCFYWLNPIFWWIKKELYLIHEFIADEKAVSNNNAASFAQMLIATTYKKFEFLPAQSFFYSPIKRRIIMLTTSKKTQFSYLRRIMVLPLIGGVICLFAFTLKQKTNASTQKIIVAKSFKLVVDAGHGGKDDGVVSNGLYEKDINLKIAEKIKELSAQYNIEVVLTRDKDVYMSPPEKLNFANAQNAGALISVHVNAADKNHSNNSGIEVLLSKRNEIILDNSKILGSAIIQNLQTNFSVEQALLQPPVGIWVLDQSKVPSALIECGYITNANDVKILQDDAKIELMARNILQGVAMFANNSFDKNKLHEIKDRSSNALKDDIDTSGKRELTSAQQEPQFPGGVDGWQKFLENNLDANVPAKNHAPKGIYTVTLTFLVDENGNVSKVKAIKDPGFGAAKEAERVIAKGPDWIPAVENGHKVAFEEKQNISFQVSN